MMGMMECFEDYFDLEKLAEKMRKDADRIPDINISAFEICDDENALYLAGAGCIKT